MGPIEELFSFDENNSWPGVFMKIRIDAMVQHDYSLKVSKKPEFKNRNRYGDVSPYDYSRICLAKNNIDYINASLVKYEPANRAYILTQGPLPGTSSHFWLMVWEQKSRAILMLNRIIEKGHIKCHQYYPTGIDDDMLFDDVGLKVTFIEEMQSNHEFTIRVLQLQNVETSESVQVMQFHYISWPDFGVPESPSAFLDFLFVVRSYGVLDDPGRPPVIHCSAGIGRSGTFCLADTCLVLIQKEGTLENLRVLDTLMEMRKCRMGLIQTHEQLRFSYLAVIEGAARINCLPEEYRHLIDQCMDPGNEADEDDDDDDDSLDDDDDININESSNVGGVIEPTNIDDDLDLPPVPPRSFESLSPKTQLVPAVRYDEEETSLENHATRQMNGSLLTEDVHESPITASIKGESSAPQELVKRKNHEERVKRTRETIDRMKTKQQESESSKNQSQLGLFFYGGLSLAVAMLGFAAYKLVNYNH